MWEIKSVSMLGSEEKLEFKLTDIGLKVKFPKQKPTEYAHVLRIELNGTVIAKPVTDKTVDKLVSTIRIMNHGDKTVEVDLVSTAGNEQ